MIDGLKKSMKYEIDDVYQIRLVGVTNDNDNMILNFDLLDFFDYEEINIFDEHLFLWDINKDRYELFFSSKPDDFGNFIGDLYLSHNELANGTVPFGKYIESKDSKYYYEFNIDIDKIRAGKGLFASGPEAFMKAYEKVLIEHSMNPSIIKSNLYYQELGKKEKYRVVVFENSYVIAKPVY